MKNIFLLMSLLVFAYPTFAQTRNLKLVKAPTGKPVNNEKRKAVVIGMSDYGGNKSLENTLNDADDMAGVLTRLGFEVTLLKNNDLRNLQTNLTNWYAGIEGNDMAVFYFAGHGMEVAGENYLIPVSADLNSQTDVQYSTLNVNQVLGNMDEKRVGMKLIILDACRDNPFKRSWSRGSEDKGLAQMSAPKGTYIAFAASPGFTAQDGKNYNLRNGVFTHYLKQEILRAGLSIDEIFNNVTGNVSTLTRDQQTPFKNSSLTRTFYFLPPENNRPLPSADNIPTPNNIQNNPPAPVVNVSELLLQADTHYKKKQYGNAVLLYKQAADQGCADAQNSLGICYEKGYGVSKDVDQAMEWYQKAAGQGNISAQQALGRLQKKSPTPVVTPPPVDASFDTDAAIYSGAANHLVTMEGVGGRLYLYSDKLYFKSHAINVQRHELTIDLNQITSVDFFKALGFAPKGLSITLSTGKVEKFVVNNRNNWKKEIEKLLQ